MSGSNEIRMSFDAKAFEMSEHEHVKEILDNLSNLENEWVLRNHTVRNFHFFVQKFNFDFPKKLSIILCVKNSWKCCGVGLFSCWQLWFHEKNWQKNLSEKLVKMLGFCQNWIFGEKFDFSNSVNFWLTRNEMFYDRSHISTFWAKGRPYFFDQFSGFALLFPRKTFDVERRRFWYPEKIVKLVKKSQIKLAKYSFNLFRDIHYVLLCITALL